jgi:hypothetical protein
VELSTWSASVDASAFTAPKGAKVLDVAAL